MKHVSCIVAAYNEAPRIGGVLNVLANHPLINEVIVVDDGSIDNTREVAGRYNTNLIALEKNQGKATAIYTGISRAEGNILLLIDADLVGLTADNITNLLTPVINQRTGMSISLRGNTPWLWKLIGLDYISGERAFAKNLLGNNLEILKTLPGFGLEVFLNRLAIKQRMKIAVVRWDSVQSPYPTTKYSFWSGLKRSTKMFREMFKTVSVFEMMYQIIAMYKLKIT